MAGYFRYLRGNQPLELYFYAVPKLCLQLMGIWPGPEGTLSWRAVMNFMILGIGVVTELHAAFKYAQATKITLALETFCPASTSAVTLLKMFLLLRYRKDLYYVVSRQRELLFGHEPMSRNAFQKEAIMSKNSLMVTRMNFWPLTAGFFTAATYNVKPFIMALVLYMQGRRDEIEWGMPYNMTMPKILLHGYFYPITFIFIAYTGYVTVYMFAGSDGFYFEFCVNVGTLFKALEKDLVALFEPFMASDEPIDGLHAERFEEGFIKIVKRQNQIISLTYFFRQRYWFITMAHFVSASLVIGCSIFLLMTVDGIGLGTLLYIFYTAAALSQLFIFCYGGTFVAESSAQLAVTLGCCPWYLCTPKHRRYVCLFILRSQRNLTMAVPFFCPSLATFAAILQASGSIIALAKSFK